MGHHLNAFLGRPDVLAGMAPAIRGLRLVSLPQGLAMAPLPAALGDAVTVDHGPLDEWRELEHDQDGVPTLGPELCAIAAVASRAGPVGWLKSEWFGGVGDTSVALWRDGVSVPVDRSAHMLAALGARRAPVNPDPDWMTRLAARISGAEPATLDEWESLGLSDWRSTARAFESGVPVEAPGPTPEQRALLADLHARLGPLALAPPQDELGDLHGHRVMDAWLFETSFVPLRLGGRAAWAFTRRHGGGLGGLLPTDPSEHGEYEAPNLKLGPDQEEGLRAVGWRLRWGCWEGAWPDAEGAVEGLMACARL